MIGSLGTILFDTPVPKWDLFIIDPWLKPCLKPFGFSIAIGSDDSTHIHPRKLTWYWKIHISNRRYIFKWWSFHCHLSFWGGNLEKQNQELPRNKIYCHACDSWIIEGNRTVAKWQEVISLLQRFPHKKLLYEWNGTLVNQQKLKGISWNLATSPGS